MGGNLRTAIDIFRDRVLRTGSRVAYKFKQEGAWHTKTWSEVDTAARETAGGLRALGLDVGDRVCLVANTRLEWVETDVGILMAGGVTVPVYQSNTPKECEYIAVDSAARAVFVEDPHQLAKLLQPDVRAHLGKVVKVVYFNDVAQLERPDDKGRLRVTLDEVLPAGSPDRAWVMSLAELRATGRDWLAANPGVLERAWEKVTPDSIFTIVYTSGTTGPPKGVVLTHSAIVFECEAVSKATDFGEEDEQLLFLPLAHIFAKILEWSAIDLGITTAFAESIPKLIDNMKEVRPTFMGAVPRVYEKAHTKIRSNLEQKLQKGGLAAKLVGWALAVGKRRSEAEQEGGQLTGFAAFQARLADKLVFSKVKATFGGRLRFFVSGGAPLSKEIAEFFHQLGILVLEGYGLTETTAATHVNRPGQYRFGTVGPALPGVEVKIAEDGEILVRGRNLLREYYGKPDATREAIDSAGWFHTGDIGLIEDGFLRITDRKKDIIVTAGGKNVAPQNIEGALKAQCPYVSQVMVHGDKRKFLSALITLNEETITAWAKEQGIAYKDLADLAQKPEVYALIQAAVTKLNADLASYETIKKFAILPRDFSQEAGEMTPTLKVKRKFCSDRYRDIIESFYLEAAAG